MYYERSFLCYKFFFVVLYLFLLCSTLNSVLSLRELKFLVALPDLPAKSNLIGDTIINVLTFTKDEFNKDRLELYCNGDERQCPDDFIKFELLINEDPYISKPFSNTLASLKKREHLIGVIGGFDALPTFALAIKASPLKLWQCSGSVTSFDQATQLLEMNLPFYYNTIHSDEEVTKYLVLFIKTMNWPRVTVLGQSGLYGAEMTQHFSMAANEKNLTIVTTQTFQAGNASNIETALNQIKRTDHKIIVYFGNEKAFLNVTKIAKQLNMLNEEYVWIGSESLAPLLYVIKESSGASYLNQLELTNGLLLLFPSPSPSRQLIQQLRTKAIDVDGPQLMGTHALLFRECFLSMAEGIVGIAPRYTLDQLLNGNYNLTTRQLREFHERDAHKKEIHAKFHVKGYTILNLFNGTMRPVYQLISNQTYFEQINAPYFHNGESTIPYYKKKLPELYLHSLHPVSIVLLSLFVLVSGSFIAILIYLYIYREHPFVKSASYPFLVLITIGLMLCLSSLILFINKPTKWKCNGRIWIFFIGLQLALSSIAAKAYRIWLIFDNTMLAKIDYLSNLYLFKGCAFILFFQAVVLTIITFFSPLAPLPIETPTAIYYRCQADPVEIDLALRSVCVALVGVMLTTTILLAYKTRTAAAAYCETNYILYTAQNIFVCALVVVPLEFVELKEFVFTACIIHICMVIFGVSASFLMLVGRIAWKVYKEQRMPKSPFPPSSLASSSSSSSSSFSSGALFNASWKLPVSLSRSTTGSPSMFKNAAVTGIFPIKAGHRFCATWEHSHVLLFPLEGYVGIVPTKEMYGKGRLFKLRTITFEPLSHLPLCIKLSMGASVYFVQFHHSLEFENWCQLFQVHCNPVPDPSMSGKGPVQGTFLAPNSPHALRYRSQALDVTSSSALSTSSSSSTTPSPFLWFQRKAIPSSSSSSSSLPFSSSATTTTTPKRPLYSLTKDDSLNTSLCTSTQNAVDPPLDCPIPSSSSFSSSSSSLSSHASSIDIEKREE